MSQSSRPWMFVLVLSCFSLVGYALRMNISIAAVLMMPELHLSQVQLGELFSGFLIGYTVFQIPWGIFGDRFGARSVLCIAAISWGVTTLLCGLLPGLAFRSAASALASLYVLRLLLGAGEAAGFPVAARAIASRMPSRRHALGYAAVVAGTAAGSALTPPLIARLITTVGWRASFYWSAATAFVLAIAWSFVARSTATGDRAAAPKKAAVQSGNSRSDPWWHLLKNSSVLLICASYFLESYVLYVFVLWSYLYLVQQRHFSLLRGGVYTGLPFLLAMLVVPVVGLLSDWLNERRGYLAGRQLPAMTGMVLSALFLFLTVTLANPHAAIAALACSVASLLSVEAIFWSSSIEIGREYAGTCGAIMNTAGNLGGIVSTAAIPLLVRRYGWNFAFGSSSVMIFCAALIWLKIHPRRGGSTYPASPWQNTVSEP